MSSPLDDPQLDAIEDLDRPRRTEKKIMRKVVNQHNAHAYIQCAACCAKTAADAAITSTQQQSTADLKPATHPSKCEDCKEELMEQLTESRSQQERTKAKIALINNHCLALPLEEEKALEEKLETLEDRESVLMKQYIRPCSYSIPLQNWMQLPGHFAPLLATRFDPRYAGHVHRGMHISFGGPAGTEAWNTADEMMTMASDLADEEDAAAAAEK
ncbi:MAG: hypothetical protein Q9174_001290 [Haloplaca sp. 1 TL-2023]